MHVTFCWHDKRRRASMRKRSTTFLFVHDEISSRSKNNKNTDDCLSFSVSIVGRWRKIFNQYSGSHGGTQTIHSFFLIIRFSLRSKKSERQYKTRFIRLFWKHPLKEISSKKKQGHIMLLTTLERCCDSLFCLIERLGRRVWRFARKYDWSSNLLELCHLSAGRWISKQTLNKYRCCGRNRKPHRGMNYPLCVA